MTEPLVRSRAALPALCLAQIAGWGVLYHAFPMLLSCIIRSTGWLTRATTAAFSAALLSSAQTGIPIGRLPDRRGPRAVMTVTAAPGEHG
ncbi:hypothetical protein ACFV0O_18620 [Kitasatospora sp. NPDC059577]|uniref:hypothetical protein n=1 Tax=Kitasatospora sp. NPDC059577 TaxID=3346873 RepID=UPI003678D356